MELKADYNIKNLTLSQSEDSNKNYLHQLTDQNDYSVEETNLKHNITETFPQDDFGKEISVTNKNIVNILEDDKESSNNEILHVNNSNSNINIEKIVTDDIANEININKEYSGNGAVVYEEYNNIETNEKQNEVTENTNATNNIINESFEVKEQNGFEDVNLKNVIKIEEDEFAYKKYELRKKPSKVQRLVLTEEKRPGKHSCQTCNKLFHTVHGLIIHMRIHDISKDYTCILCNRSFNTNIQLIEHKSIHEQTYTCDCGLVFNTHSEFLIHKITHSKKSILKCYECAKYFGRKSYAVHILTHCENFKCHCGRQFKSEHYLNLHKKTHEPNIECVECGKVCSKSNYFYHMCTHTGVKQFQCWYCGKAFINSMQRKIHTRVHTNERSFECELCFAKFKQTTDLKKHLATHEVEKRFQCDYCKKKFYVKDSLVFHLQRHMKIAPFKCIECRFSCVNYQGLQNHVIRAHTDEKPFKCVPCRKFYKHSSDFAKHRRDKKHLEVMYDLFKKNK